ncbi:MAG: glycosyltransferase, partial [Flavobacteriaceae bacterium]
MYQVAIIIINYNFEEFTIGLIESILKYTSKEMRYEIIVVDNASEAESYEKLETYLKQFKDQEHIRWIRSAVNRGFGGGNNLGVSQANSEY